LKDEGKTYEVLYLSICSGRGIGKSAFLDNDVLSNQWAFIDIVCHLPTSAIVLVLNCVSVFAVINPVPPNQRGIGKSAFLAMINYWFISCWFGGTGLITANTETQLRTRTMAEVGKWHTMSINA
jgi:hypothetical protein